MANLDGGNGPMKKGAFRRGDILKQLPRASLGLLLVLIGILCFTNHNLFSEFLLYVSVYVIGVFFFLVGAALILAGLWIIRGIWHKPQHKAGKPWLDICMVAVLVLSIGVILSSGLTDVDEVTTSGMSGYYAERMAQLAPTTTGGFTFRIQIMGRLSQVGGGWLGLIFVVLGNDIGIKTIGTKVVFSLLMIGSVAVLLRIPTIAIMRAIAKIKAERLSVEVTAPKFDPDADYSLRQKKDAARKEDDKKANSHPLPKPEGPKTTTNTVFVTTVFTRQDGQASPKEGEEKGQGTDKENDDGASEDHLADSAAPFAATAMEEGNKEAADASSAMKAPIKRIDENGLEEAMKVQSPIGKTFAFKEPTQPKAAVIQPESGLKPSKEEEPNLLSQRPKEMPADYVLPGATLLKDYDNTQTHKKLEDLALKEGILISRFFQDYKILAHVDGYTIGASVTRFHVRLEPGVKMSAIDGFLQNLKVRLSGNPYVRFIPVVEGADYSGIDVGNPTALIVPFKDCYKELMVEDRECKNPTLIPLGKDIAGNVITLTLANMPHLLVAGSTGSGKSVFVHSLIMSMIMRTYPDELKFLLIDPKRVEFSKYADMPHLYCPIVTDSKLAVEALRKMVDEMERRYTLLQQAGVTNIGEYRKWAQSHPDRFESLPTIIVIIDEFADLMATNKEAEDYVARLTAKARACGIHLVVATQRPSVDVITGDIKNNIPARIAFSVYGQTDSRVVLDDVGAESLLGKGDLLAKIPGHKSLIRAKSAFVSDEEINAVVKYLKANAKPNFNPDFMDLEDEDGNREDGGEIISPKARDEEIMKDPLYAQVKQEVLETGRAAVHYIMHRFGIAYAKAVSYLDVMEEEGLVKTVGNGQRIVIGEQESGTGDSGSGND